MEFSVFPVSGDAVRCGLRKDLPKEQRYHLWVFLGADVRHFGEGEFDQSRVFACRECGADKYKRLHPKPKVREPVKVLDPEIKARRDALRRSLFDAGITGQAREQALAEFDRQVETGDNIE